MDSNDTVQLLSPDVDYGSVSLINIDKAVLREKQRVCKDLKPLLKKLESFKKIQKTIA